jgi:ubiquinol-cytochrome c reductase subunit 7
LRLHDILADSVEIRDALSRLPPNLKEERDWRIKRAFDLGLKKIQLPQAEWTKPEEDIPYLRPYLDDVRQEEHDRFELYPAD